MLRKALPMATKSGHESRIVSFPELQKCGDEDTLNLTFKQSISQLPGYFKNITPS